MTRKAALVAVLGASTLVPAVPAGAQGEATQYMCRASVISARIGNNTLEPAVANGPNKPCLAAAAGGPQDISVGNPASGQIVANGVFARTTLAPQGAPLNQTIATAEAGVASATVRAPGLTIAVSSGGKAKTTISCQSDAAVIRDEGTAGTVTVNGLPVVLESLPIFGTPLSDGSGLALVSFNEIVREGDANAGAQQVIRRAIHVQLFKFAEGAEPAFESIIAEARIGRIGGTCGPITGGSGAGGGVTGATVVPVNTILGAISASPCKNRKYGRQFAIVASNKADRITGTNKSDRIFAFKGDDRVSSGRGNDCIEAGSGLDRADGGSGNDLLLGDSGNDNLSGGPGKDRFIGGNGRDRISGGTGNDRLIGGSGRDRLFGGNGNDRIEGGTGNDVINTNNGRDIVSGGRGNDTINAATAGKPSRINCGPGVDTVRLNFNERKRTKNCERILSTTRIR